MPVPEPLPAGSLHATFDPARLPWKHSRDIPTGRNGGRSPFQPRAMQALDLALQIRAAGYHVYLSGEPNLGRSHMLRNYLEPRAKKMPTPPDLVYVHNFAEPDSPVLLELPAGVGREFRSAIREMLGKLGRSFAQRLDSPPHMDRRAQMMDEYQETRAEILGTMHKIASDAGFGLDLGAESSVKLVPMQEDGKIFDEGEFSRLPGEIRLDYRRRVDRVAKIIAPHIRRLGRAEEQLHERERELERETMKGTLEEVFAPVRDHFQKLVPSPAMKEYFAAFHADLLENTDALAGEEERKEERRCGEERYPDHYGVNLFVDNSGLSGAPIVWEDNPAHLMGCMERESEMGTLVTDVGLIRAGSLHRANGGFLVLHVEDLLQHPGAFEGLLRSLRSGEARIEDSTEAMEGGIRARTLRPDPLPLKLKVVLIGTEDVHETLLTHDDRFAKLFRIKAHMTDEAERNAANVRIYLGQIARIIAREELLHFDAGALGWLVDLGSHLCEDQKRLSLKFPVLREMMIEADALARMGNHPEVTAPLLEEAWTNRNYRGNLAEEIFMEEYDRELIKVETSGSAVGRVNGLSVTMNGEFEFGLPHRISCTVGVGNEGIIDLEREAELGGPIHTKAMMIIKSFLTEHFARKKPLVLSASLYFEQSYAGIEGDSASGAELVALLSCLANVPVRLDLAFTGAVSHSGEILAVGGVTAKVEGFYKVCARHGLTGTQGVIIPHDNVDHLMLSPGILQSVEEGKFAIYSVRTLEEAISLLTGLKAGKRRKDGAFTPDSLYDLVDKRLQKLGEHAHNAFKRGRRD